MVELLQRVTSMPVAQVTDRQKVKPDCVYVIPPNSDMSILHGVLHLLAPAAPRGLRLPIDFFFRSLAADRGDTSIGVILSGMGSDGTLGLRAIKERAGLVLTQSLDSAKFDGMPRSAIDSGVVDIIATVEDLPVKIINYLQTSQSHSRKDLTLDGKAQSSLEKIVILLRDQSGHDFSLYKKNTIYRRIERRMGLHQLTKIADYVRYLRSNPQETELLFKELLIGVTSFFRDPVAWKQMQTEVIPALLVNHPPNGMLRAWVTGCSTGEEAYSLAIVFKEVMAKLDPPKNITLQIYATDLDKDAIDKARTGIYPANIAADVSTERLNRFFVQDDDQGGYRVSKEIRDMVIFAVQNLVMDPPFIKLDILSCRNLLIYLGPELQKKLLPLFHYSINPDGFLFLGCSETIGTFNHLFAPLAGKMRLYRRLDTIRRAELIDFPSSFSQARPEGSGPISPQNDRQPAPNLQTLADHLLLQQYSPAAVLTSNRGDILYISGRTGKYLEPAAGKANWNIFVMAREGLRYTINDALQKAQRQGKEVILKEVKVGINGGSQFVDITVQPLFEPEAMRGMVLFVFRDMIPPPEQKSLPKRQRASVTSIRLAQMEQELQLAHEETQSTREEMQTSQEELKATNEELQSTNEELQSTNEELTTSKEEMQSMNEELQTVNHELQAKVDELSWASNDMKNLLDSTDIATIFLDAELRLRRFTIAASQIIKLIPGDIGRPITDIASTLIYSSLATDTEEVLRTLVFKENQVATHDGRWFLSRIMPYRTHNNKIDGVVITFTNITEKKRLEIAVQELSASLQQFKDNSSDAFFFVNDSFAITSCNPAAERMLGRRAFEVQGTSFVDLFPGVKGVLRGQGYCQAMQEKGTFSFDFHCVTASYQGKYTVRIYAQTDCVSISVQRVTGLDEEKEARP